MKECCKHTNKDSMCIRKSDSKIFKLPRKFSRSRCVIGSAKGFTMRSSCAPYKDCTAPTKPFLYHPNNPNKSFNVYVNKNPNDTIPIKYKTLQDVKNTIKKLETLYKTNKYPHKRIVQVSMILYVRLKVLKQKKPKEFQLAMKYFEFLKTRTKIKEEISRKKIIFN